MSDEKKISPRNLLLSIANKLADSNVDLTPLFGAELAEQIAAFYANAAKKSVRGLSIIDQLNMVTNHIDDLYVTMPTVGTPEHSLWAADLMKSLNKQARLTKKVNAEAVADTTPAKSKAAK